jgi:hypothetical protein
MVGVIREIDGAVDELILSPWPRLVYPRLQTTVSENEK